MAPTPLPSFFRRYLLPGFVFQSVVVAGGYGTGRELVEFFLTQGPAGGLLALGAATLVWSAVCMATFEFARRFRHYEYRTFFKELLGPGWVVFEVAYLILLLIVLAVVAAASGQILLETFGLPYWVGVVVVMTAVAALVFGGSEVIEGFLAGWSFLLYAVYVVFFVWCFTRFGGDIVAAFDAEPVGRGWPLAGVRYAAYNLAVIPAVLFTVRSHRTSREALGAGALAGVIAIVPGLLFYLAMVGQYPAVLDRPVPANFLLEILGSTGFQMLFQVVLFGTLVETGAGLIHSVNERLAGAWRKATATGADPGASLMPRWVRPAVSLLLLSAGAGMSAFGLVGLVARGYGTLTWVFLLVYVVPVLTIGVWKMRRGPADPVDAHGETGPGIEERAAG